jgi:hypothetical protein
LGCDEDAGVSKVVDKAYFSMLVREWATTVTEGVGAFGAKYGDSDAKEFISVGDVSNSEVSIWENSENDEWVRRGRFVAGCD